MQGEIRKMDRAQVMNKHSVSWDSAAGGRSAGGAGGLRHSETLQWQRPFVLLPWMLPQREVLFNFMVLSRQASLSTKRRVSSPGQALRELCREAL